VFCYAAKWLTYLQPAESTADLSDGPGRLYLEITTALINIAINDPKHNKKLNYTDVRHYTRRLYKACQKLA